MCHEDYRGGRGKYGQIWADGHAVMFSEFDTGQQYLSLYISYETSAVCLFLSFFLAKRPDIAKV